MKTAKIGVELFDLENMICGIEELSSGLNRETLSYTENAILHTDRNQTEGENAIDFIQANYGTIQGAFRLIESVSHLIATAFANDEIQLAEGNRYK